MDYVAEVIKEFIEGAIKVSPREMAIQIASTLLLFLIVRFFFWNNITNYLEGRREHMAKEFDEASQANLEAQTIKTESQVELDKIRLSAKDVVEDAKSRGEKERTDIIGKAKNDATVIIDNAKKEIDSEIEKARTSINDEIVSVAVLMAEKVIKKKIDENTKSELLESVTKEVIN